MDAQLWWPRPSIAPIGLGTFLSLPFDICRSILCLLESLVHKTHETGGDVYLGEKMLKHAELASFAAVIELINLMNEEWLNKMLVNVWSLSSITLRTTVPPRRVDLSVLVVVHDPSADPTAS